VPLSPAFFILFPVVFNNLFGFWRLCLPSLVVFFVVFLVLVFGFWFRCLT
jgi:hypothetical protein